MRKVLLYSLLLGIGLIGSQFLDGFASEPIRLLTTTALSFIMIHVGFEFEMDRSRPLRYAWDALIAASAACIPWILCAIYFVFVMAPSPLWSHPDTWKESLLQGLFAAPTSAGVLFSMLAAAGLSASWVFKKARVLAIFDDLVTVLLLVPMKMLMVGNRWQLWLVVLVIGALLVLAWKYLHSVKLPSNWTFVLTYAVLIVIVSEIIHLASMRIDPAVPVHLEVLLPAFVLGCLIKLPAGAFAHDASVEHGHEKDSGASSEQRAATIVSACFMVLVGLSMPAIRTTDIPSTAVAVKHLRYEGISPQTLEIKSRFPGWGVISVHVMIVTLLSNLGKMLPALCYRKEAALNERLAIAVGMFPRGEVGAGVLVISISYGLAGPVLTVAVLSLVLNLVCTGLFIVAVQRLLRRTA